MFFFSTYFSFTRNNRQCTKSHCENILKPVIQSDEVQLLAERQCKKHSYMDIDKTNVISFLVCTFHSFLVILAVQSFKNLFSLLQSLFYCCHVKKNTKIKASTIILDSGDSVFWFWALEVLLFGCSYAILNPFYCSFVCIVHQYFYGSIYNKINDLNV